jgi:hypothetical protein
MMRGHRALILAAVGVIVAFFLYLVSLRSLLRDLEEFNASDQSIGQFVDGFRVESWTAGGR